MRRFKSFKRKADAAGIPTLAAILLGVVGTTLLVRRRWMLSGPSARVSLDADLPDLHREVVGMAMAREEDPVELHSLAAKLGAAGYLRSAKAVAERAAQVRAGFFQGGFYKRDPQAEADWAQQQIAAMYPSDAGGAPFMVTRGDVVGQDVGVVLRAQKLLRSIGYDVEVDGVLGPHTRQALMHFQSLHDLDVDGAPGPATMTLLAFVAGKI